VLLACICWSGISTADEGFWLFSSPPRISLAARYGFAPPAGWFGHLMRSSAELRIGPDTYVSGAFVSQDGLFITAFHVGSQVIEPQEATFAREGFLARRISDERKLPGVVIRSLVSTTDVTDQITRSSAADLKAQLAGLEAESTRRTGLSSRVVTLWGGAKYELYRYATYTDVRLVFCPEAASAIVRDPATGHALRHPESFHFDICLFRVYERGKPARLREYLEWSDETPREGELVLASGSPISSQRLGAGTHLQLERDVVLPLRIARARQLESASTELGADELAEAARAERAYWDRERSFLATATMDDDAPGRASQAAGQMAAEFPRYYLLEEAAGFDAELFDYARILVRNPSERSKADYERQPMYAAANWRRLDGWMRTKATVDRRVQQARLYAWLCLLNQTLGQEDPIVRRVLDGLAPLQRARQIVASTRVDDLELRGPIWTGGGAIGAGARDPMLDLARDIEEEARRLRDRKVALEASILEAHGRVALARSTANRTEAYPDASGSLRLSYGVVQGYGQVPASSTFGQLRAWMDSRNPAESSALSAVWMQARSELNSSTPFNVAATADVIGGSSGSPVVNREGRLVGVMRGLNEAAPMNPWVYDSTRTRSIYVAAAAIVEALRKVYGAEELADELAISKRHAGQPRGTSSRSPTLPLRRAGKLPESRVLP
jgi:hypothetical protein